ncbi:MAG TPA: imidazole glycerol phosphate synthase subunit HisH [candidate division Zixibacteria bacterium]|nr:imidazole glycerol phosphate synthase subunit HisH [candidate division Zixibacteria bacterium]
MIGVVDFGAGNTRSVLRGLAAVGAATLTVDRPAQLDGVDRLVLPGVGAAGSAVRELRRRDLWEPLRAWGVAGRPLLGICLGAQLLLDRSEEDAAEGLGLIPGVCRAFPPPQAGGPRRVPHIGWNEVRLAGGVSVEAYFVHGYWLDPADPACVRGTSEVDGFTFPAVVRRGSLTGVQFHPEKSAAFGRALLAAFAQGLLDAPHLAALEAAPWT